MTRQRIIVLGAGVSGLTTAVTMALAGCDVAIHAAEGPGQTTSALAAAIWHPFYQAPDFVYLERARQTYATMARLSADTSSGVLMRTLTEYFRRDAGVPWWAECARDLKRLPETDVPSRFACAYRMAVPVADTGIYLRYLMNMFLELGGRFEQQRVDDPAPLLDDADYVVNCCGYGSRQFGDNALSLSRAIVLRARRDAAVRGCFIDDSDPAAPTYIVERDDDIVLGGTADPELTSTVIGDRQIADIVRRCTQLCEGVAVLRVIEARTGFRPMRRVARVAVDERHSRLLHNYGHGGGGFTLSWGCANDVLRLAGLATAN
ncbi:FAD-dependent oxidoreductase [Pandoraea sp. SD6-2]|uniref:FAD-dependent oxidoreductase n=1 Tax=Pandoraea sp. SD6-2 TaxID=1286093 RepID=UPI00032E7834|nr:FAD-dependent oxidoreductase [Pandoraea sp. SD6-2]EON14459.1 FAD dependent oxidoreductase [Pandoraea sp. SD6-2]